MASKPRRAQLRPAQLDQRLDGWRRELVRVGAPHFGDDSGPDPTRFPVDWFVVVAEDDNELVCQWRDDTARTYAVLKPPKLRGATATRSGASGATQQIVPVYTSGDTIYAAAVPGGADAGYSASGATVPYDYVDLNLDGRFWAEAVT